VKVYIDIPIIDKKAEPIILDVYGGTTFKEILAQLSVIVNKNPKDLEILERGGRWGCDNYQTLTEEAPIIDGKAIYLLGLRSEYDSD
jgi:hypothetical protein